MQTINLIGSFTLGMLLTAVPVLSANVSAVPNKYDLQNKNKNVTIAYSTTSLDGKPRLTYKDQHQTLNFVGKQIHSETTDIGTLVTVTIFQTVDTGNTLFTLLLPRVNLVNSTSATIETKGIITTNRFSVNPQLNQGQTQTYITIPLTGTAQAVAF